MVDITTKPPHSRVSIIEALLHSTKHPDFFLVKSYMLHIVDFVGTIIIYHHNLESDIKNLKVVFPRTSKNKGRQQT